MLWLTVRSHLALSPWPARLVTALHDRAQAVVANMTRRRPRAVEAVLWLNTVWWGYVFTAQAHRLADWAAYWRVGRAGAPVIWGELSILLAGLALAGWALRSHGILRLWLLLSVAWYLFVGVWLGLARQWYNPNTLYPLLLAWLALVAYLELGVQADAGGEPS